MFFRVVGQAEQALIDGLHLVLRRILHLFAHGLDMGAKELDRELDGLLRFHLAASDLFRQRALLGLQLA